MLVCRFVGIVFKYFGQPVVIGEIVAGASEQPETRRARGVHRIRAGAQALRVPKRPRAWQFLAAPPSLTLHVLAARAKYPAASRLTQASS